MRGCAHILFQLRILIPFVLFSFDSLLRLKQEQIINLLILFANFIDMISTEFDYVIHIVTKNKMLLFSSVR